MQAPKHYTVEHYTVKHYTLKDEAIVDETIQPGRAGRVRYQSSFWFARCEQAIVLPPGSTVRVIGYEGIRLLVEPVALVNPPSSAASGCTDSGCTDSGCTDGLRMPIVSFFL